MKTPEEIKKALACPVSWRGHLLGCSNCAYHGRGLQPCRTAVHDDALTYIDQLEEQVALMKIQMRGDCGVCKHRGGNICNECLQKYDRPQWEYEGLPELKKEENK